MQTETSAIHKNHERAIDTMLPNLCVNIGKLRLKNPVMVSSGTFGYTDEFKDFIALNKLGAIVTKTITLKPRQGNPSPRTAETPAGMLNSIGLENPGLEGFIKEKLPMLKQAGVPIIVSIASEGDAQDFIILAKQLDKIKEIQAIELNISCPNIQGKSKIIQAPCLAGRQASSKPQARLIAQDPKATYEVVKSVRKATGKTLITKLSPNVTDIIEVALAAQRAGADALSLINTLSAMSIDVHTRKAKLASVTGGLSGPAIRPLAVRMVWEAYKKVSIPIIGMGGIMDTPSALEFFIAGARAVSIGTGNFVNPKASIEVIDGLKAYLIKNKINSMQGLIGKLII